MKLSVPIVFRCGAHADAHLEKDPDALTVRIILPTRMAYVDPWKDDPVTWVDIDPPLTEIWLPEDMLSDAIRKKLSE